MISRLAAFVILLLLALIVQMYPYGIETGGAPTVVALGFVILAGYLLGELLQPLRLPRISGYLFAGMLFGPYIGGILTQQTVKDLTLIDTIALSLIALSAGGELQMDFLKKGWKAIVSITLAQSVGVLVFSTAFFYFVAQALPFWTGFTMVQTISAALVFGVIAIAQSPSTTIAIINETQASGIATNTTLGVAVIKDVFVITLFTVALTVIEMLEQGIGAVQISHFLQLAGEIVFSIVAGIFMGVGISLYLRFINMNQVLFILAFSYLVSVGSKTLHLDPILVCVFAGMWVTNASKQGEELIKTIEKGSLIVYVIFFCVAGAMLNLSALEEMKWIALTLVGARMLFLWATTWAGVKLSRIPIPTVHSYWMAFLPQAGVSLGLLAILNKKGFEWAPVIYTLVLACIALNQILGPITMKYALQKTGETKE